MNLRLLFFDWTGSSVFTRSSVISASIISSVKFFSSRMGISAVISLKTEYMFFFKGLFRLVIFPVAASFVSMYFAVASG